jgi:hypothetical protein
LIARAVTRVEVLVVTKAGFALDDRDAHLFGGARIDRGLVDHDAARRDGAPDGAAGRFQRTQVGALELVDGVGTVTMNTLQSASASAWLEQVSIVAARSSSDETSSVWS